MVCGAGVGWWCVLSMLSCDVLFCYFLFNFAITITLCNLLAVRIFNVLYENVVRFKYNFEVRVTSKVLGSPEHRVFIIILYILIGIIYKINKNNTTPGG